MRRTIQVGYYLLAAVFLAVSYNLISTSASPNLEKCVFSADEPEVLIDCQKGASRIDFLSGIGQGNQAIDITRDLLNAFEQVLLSHKETSAFAGQCSTQDSFYWLKLESIQSSTKNPKAFSQIYSAFPETRMDGSSIERQVPLIKYDNTAANEIEITNEPKEVEGTRVYIPRLTNCNEAIVAFRLDEGDLKLVHIPVNPSQDVVVELDNIKVSFSIIKETISGHQASHIQKHQTYSFDNMILLISDIFHKSIAMRYSANDPVLSTAFIIDFHNRILPHLTKGSKSLWRETVADFNFVIDSGLVQGAILNSVESYYIN